MRDTHDSVFFNNSDLTPEKLSRIVRDGLNGSDYGEFYQEDVQSESISRNMGTTTVSVGNGDSGFGFRVGKHDQIGYTFSQDFNESALLAAVNASRQILKGHTSATTHVASGSVEQTLYTQDNALGTMSIEEKLKKVDEIEAYVRTLDPNIVNVAVNYNSKSKLVKVVNAEGETFVESRPYTSLGILIVMKDENGKIEQSYGHDGGRITADEVFEFETYSKVAQKVLADTKMLLIADEAPSGRMDCVLSNGWSGIILHEAVGHGLEGDFNRRDISVYSGKVGKKIANENVTIVDQGDLPDQRGSTHFDDEGTKTQRNVLVEDGVLKKYMQDRRNAQLMGVDPTGNGRRQSYRHAPMPRMTNTYFERGKDTFEDMIASTKDGLFIDNFSNGQVDIVSGTFNMNASLAYRIRNGKICEPVKGASIIGSGLEVINKIDMIGSDLALPKAAGMCGKDGQSVPVGVGQPAIKVRDLQIGGSKQEKKKSVLERILRR